MMNTRPSADIAASANLQWHGAPAHLLSKAFDREKIAHGFFGRTGGVSSGVYMSLNTGDNSADDARAVANNRRLCAEAIGADAAHLVTLKQIHSASVITIDAPFENTPPQADALVTNTPGLAIAILTADCMPILLADIQAGVIGAAHAGWRGALNGVIEATIQAMVQLGAATPRIKAALGPCLRQENFEVGLDLVQAFTDKHPHTEQLFAPGVSAQKRQFDAPAFAYDRLRASGVESLDDLRICTLSQQDQLFSYRGAKKSGQSDYGRNLSVIMIRN